MIFLGLFGTPKNFPVPVFPEIELIPVKFLRSKQAHDVQIKVMHTRMEHLSAKPTLQPIDRYKSKFNGLTNISFRIQRKN